MKDVKDVKDAATPSLHARSFEALTPLELYRLLQLRSQVFVVEQTCVFQDLDDHDLRAVHLFTEVRADAPLAGCLRLFPPGVTYPEASLGRVATAPFARRSGLGRALVTAGLAYLDAHHPGPVHIGAQAYLARFYGSFGFVQVGEGYVEDGIPHLSMLRPQRPQR